jgi:hypothetical protein
VNLRGYVAQYYKVNQKSKSFNFTYSIDYIKLSKVALKASVKHGRKTIID